MSFFIKCKRKQNDKIRKNRTNIPKAQMKEIEDDEITSSSEQDSEDVQEFSEDEVETTQEKRLRCTKIYLENIEKHEKDRLDDEDTVTNVSLRLKEDFLKQSGKLKNAVADKYREYESNYLNILQCKGHKNAITCICVSSDDKYVFSGSKDGRIVKWSLFDRKQVAGLPFIKRHIKSSTAEGHSYPITCVAISDDFKFFAVGTESNQIEIWNPKTFKHIHSFKNHRDSLTGVIFRKNSNYLYSCSKDGTVKIWSLDEMSYLQTLFGHADYAMDIDALSKERAVTAGGMDNSLRVWKIAEDSQLIFSGTGTIDCVKFINEDYFISGGTAGELCVWSLVKKKPLCTVKNAHGFNQTNHQPFWIISVATLVNTDLVASGSSDGLIRLWKVFDSYRSISPVFNIPAVGFVNGLQFSSNGMYLLAGIGREHRCGRWNLLKEARNGIMIIPLIKSA